MKDIKDKVKTTGVEYNNTIILIFENEITLQGTEKKWIKFKWSAYGAMSGSNYETFEDALTTAKESVDSRYFTTFIKGEQ